MLLGRNMNPSPVDIQAHRAAPVELETWAADKCNDVYSACCAMSDKKSFASDPGVWCLLSTYMRQWQANLLTCK